MREIGVRELKTHLSEALREVARGEPLRVTVRGRAVADLVPTEPRRHEGHLRELVASGRLVLPTQARPRRAPRLVQTDRSASALVLAERDDER
jgi:prevent-host-death family protein